MSLARRTGELLLKLVDDGNVRAMEGLAIVIARSDWGRICAAAAAPAQARSLASEAEVAACERIGRRALAGTLTDQTGGATRFHRTGDLPEWARGHCPSAQIGEFFFYKI